MIIYLPPNHLDYAVGFPLWQPIPDHHFDTTTNPIILYRSHSSLCQFFLWNSLFPCSKRPKMLSYLSIDFFLCTIDTITGDFTLPVVRLVLLKWYHFTILILPVKCLPFYLFMWRFFYSLLLNSAYLFQVMTLYDTTLEMHAKWNAWNEHFL